MDKEDVYSSWFGGLPTLSELGARECLTKVGHLGCVVFFLNHQLIVKKITIASICKFNFITFSSFC